MDSLVNNSARSGRLANNSLFFGSDTAETISAPIAYGGWNNDYAGNSSTAMQWFFRGGRSDQGGVGLFAFAEQPGAARNDISHRTILLGY
ncbi:hypothetical protein FWG76_02325 [Candidatus Saccharibacteria bacterium]|nr:hypothetical protein [Candidatus Saccharibacteria bacterium]